MELYEVLNAYCSRSSGAVSKEDKRRHSYMLRRLFSSTYPIQCSLINNLNTDPVCASNIIALLSSRYSGLPDFLKIRVDQKKKKESRNSNTDKTINHLRFTRLLPYFLDKYN